MMFFTESYPCSLTDLDSVYMKLKSVIRELLSNVGNIRKDLHDEYQSYLKTAFIFSKNFEKDPFKLDPLQEEIVTGDPINHEIMIYIK